VFLLGGTDKGQEAQADPVAPEVPVANPEPTPPTPEPVAPEPATPEPVATSSTKVISDPEGASLYKGTALMGQLPFDLVKPKAGDPPVHYTIKLDGYEDLDVMIAANTPDEFKLSLKKIKRSSSSSGKKKKSSSGSGGSSGSDGKVIKVKKKKKKLGDLADPWS